MTEEGWREKLKEEGYGNFFVWQDTAHTEYPEHTHPHDTVHIVLEGSMTITMDGKEHTLSFDNRLDMPAGKKHTAKIGPEGCRYLVGEK